MSEQQPGPPSYGAPVPTGVPASYGTPPPPPDFLTAGPGGPGGPMLPPTDGGSGGHRRWWYVGGAAVVAVALVGGGIAVAATHLGKGRDVGAAAALPSDTLAYAAIDLDPNAGQKIEAIKALRKFPAFSKGVKLDPTADLRQKLVTGALGASDCELSWDDDIKPWVGTDVAAAVVPTTHDGPQPVVVIGSTDQSKAKSELPKILACGNAQKTVGLDITKDWVVIAKTDAIAKGVADGAQGGALADDTDYKTWVGRTGDPGVATFYAAPGAGTALANNIDKLAPMLEQGMAAAEEPSYADGSGFSYGSADASTSAYRSGAPGSDVDPLAGVCAGGSIAPPTPLGPTDPLGPMMDQEKSQLAKFGGGAATLRFAHGGFEWELAAKQATTSGARAGAGQVATLPDDTAAAIGGSFDQTVLNAFLTGMAAGCGTDTDSLTSALNQLTGLNLPDDFTTLFGQGVTLSLGRSISQSTIDNEDVSGLPLALHLQGDPAKISSILEKFRAQAQGMLDGSSGSDSVVVGPDADYRAEVLKGGKLGDQSEFKDVVPHAAQASMVEYVAFDQLQSWIKAFGDASSEDLANIAPLRAFGASTWVDGGITHGLARLSLK